MYETVYYLFKQSGGLTESRFQFSLWFVLLVELLIAIAQWLIPLQLHNVFMSSLTVSQDNMDPAVVFVKLTEKLYSIHIALVSSQDLVLTVTLLFDDGNVHCVE